MNYTIQGTDQPTILFIHGFCESLSIWSAFEQALKDQYQVVSIDLPGHGKSKLEQKEFTIEDVADQVVHTLKSKGIQRFFPIGHSLGGYVSLAIADLYPESVSGFGLFSSTTFPDDEEKKKVRDKVGGFIAEHGHQSFIDSFVPNLFTPENRRKFDQEIEELKKEAYLTSTESIIAYSQAMKKRPDRSFLLNNLKPKFIIAGDRDMAVRLEASKEMMKYLSEEDTLILDDAGHNGFLEGQDSSILFIKSFFSRNSIIL